MFSFQTMEALAVIVTVDDASVVAKLQDGRSISVPLAWYPRLAVARPNDRAAFQLISGGASIDWPALDTTISIDAMLRGRMSIESESSLAQWQRKYTAAVGC